MNPYKVILNHGIARASKHYFRKLLALFGFFYSFRDIKLRNIKKLDAQLRGVVRYGLFKGLILSEQRGWSYADRISMVLGLYEMRVLEVLSNASFERSVFIDVGAADGFYAVGFAISGKFKAVHAFEITSKGRDVIKKVAELNNVSELVCVHGAGDKSTIGNIVDQFCGQNVILIDIEGGEFDLFNDEIFLEKIHGEIIIIELHSHLVQDGAKKTEELFGRLKKFFDVYIFNSGPRDPLSIPELQNLNEDIVWGLISEGRDVAMTWALCIPKSSQILFAGQLDYLRTAE